LKQFQDRFKDYRLKIDNALSDYLKAQTKRSYYSEEQYPHTLFDPLNYIMDGSGKRIRPLMLILSCEAFGGTIDDALSAAIAIEILHNFTLVHDDIMDNANTRRGKETIHKRWSVNTAILVGDELIGLSYRSLLNTKSKRIDEVVKAFTNGVIEVCEGQALDYEYETAEYVGLPEYMKMINKKTAELIRISAVMGALIAGANEEQLKIISAYSENLGIAFQIQDDLLDVIANEKQFGKKIGGDILEKKKTYLYLKSLELCNGDEKNELMKMYNSDTDPDEKIKNVIAVYEKVNAAGFAKKDIEEYTGKANEYLSRIGDGEGKNKLKYFSNILLNRNY
jgi:geranylgeranyl diphosphate synthase type II